MEKVRPWCGQPSDRGWLKNRNRNYWQDASRGHSAIAELLVYPVRMRWVRHAAGLAAVIGDALMFCIANCDRFFCRWWILYDTRLSFSLWSICSPSTRSSVVLWITRSTLNRFNNFWYSKLWKKLMQVFFQNALYRTFKMSPLYLVQPK